MSEATAEEIRATLMELVRPRMTGTPGAQATEKAIMERFRTLGYVPDRLPFSFSTLPGRFGLPVAGALLAGAGVAGGHLLSSGYPVATLIVLASALALAVLPLAVLPRALSLPWGRVSTVNLLFVREAPRILVMAHRDTKSQRAPTLVRSAALVGAGGAWLAMAGWAAAQAIRVEPFPASVGPAVIMTLVLAACGLVLMLSPAANRSPGAMDNGTGLAALLALAGRVPPDVGFLVTDGEELGLAGARAAAEGLPPVDAVVNLDGLDDGGPVRIAETRRRPVKLAAVLEDRSRARGVAVVRRPLPPLLMVDHQPLAVADVPAFSVLKGGWGSLLRVHSPRDTVARIRGSGAAEVVNMVVEALRAPPRMSHGTLPAKRGSQHSPPP